MERPRPAIAETFVHPSPGLRAQIYVPAVTALRRLSTSAEHLSDSLP